MWSWTTTRQPRPNVKTHPLDAYQMPERLRGGAIEDEKPEAVLAWLLGAGVVWAIVLLILWMVPA